MRQGSLAARPRVMVVHDKADFALKLADWLAAHGYEVAIARDLEEVLELLHDHRPDGIVLDLHLRALSGMQVLRIIKSICPAIPVVTITETPLNDLALLSVKAGACAFLIRPFEPQHLSTLLDAHLQGRRVRDYQSGALSQARTATPHREGMPVGDQPRMQ